MEIKTPYYLIDEGKLLKNLKRISYLRKHSGAKSLLALKCFSSWSVFDLMRPYLDGTTSSSLYEARLGREKFGKEVHAYSVAFSKDEINEIKKYSDKIIFNSCSQLKRFHKQVATLPIGLRINPLVSYSHFDLADPARKHSRLGVINKNQIIDALPLINGAMFHFNCENSRLANLTKNLDTISRKYNQILKKLDWVSLGGGIYFTQDGFPLKKFTELLKEFSEKHTLQIYLEPGETAITESTQLVTEILDIVNNNGGIAIVDASIEAHMLDLLVYRIPAKIKTSGSYKYTIAGRSCLAGDIFGTYGFKSPLKIGQTIRISDAAGYTMVKKNWFNGLPQPAIAVRRLNGKIDLVRKFGYRDFLNSI